MPADPGRSGRPLRPSRRRFGAHRPRADRRRVRVRAIASPCRSTSPGRSLALYLACLRAGLVYLPLNTGYQRSELDYFFDDAKPRVARLLPGPLGVVEALAARRDGPDAGRERGDLLERAADRPATFDTSSTSAGRPCRDPLHVRHDRSLEGRDAHAPQSRVERADAGRALGIHARRRAAARAADLSRAWPVRRAALRAPVGRADAVARRNSTPRKSARCCRARR